MGCKLKCPTLDGLYNERMWHHHAQRHGHSSCPHAVHDYAPTDALQTQGSAMCTCQCAVHSARLSMNGQRMFSYVD